jgi:hypothetical protein
MTPSRHPKPKLPRLSPLLGLTGESDRSRQLGVLLTRARHADASAREGRYSAQARSTSTVAAPSSICRWQRSERAEPAVRRGGNLKQLRAAAVARASSSTETHRWLHTTHAGTLAH